MSKTTKRKYVVKEVLLDYVQPTGNQRIVKVLGSPGNNLHEVETAEGETFLVSMPTKFRKNIWIKRGDFVIVDPIAEGEKVKAEISFIIFKDHQKLLQKEGLWPPAFSKENDAQVKESNKLSAGETIAGEKSGVDSRDEDSEDDNALFVNTNRVQYKESDDSEEESDDKDREEDSDDDDDDDDEEEGKTNA